MVLPDKKINSEETTKHQSSHSEKLSYLRRPYIPSGFGRFPSASLSSETILFAGTLAVALAAAAAVLVLSVPLGRHENKIEQSAVGGAGGTTFVFVLFSVFFLPFFLLNAGIWCCSGNSGREECEYDQGRGTISTTLPLKITHGDHTTMDTRTGRRGVVWHHPDQR